MNNLPKVVTQRCPMQDFNPRPTDRKSNAIPVALPRHLVSKYLREFNSIIICNVQHRNVGK